MLISSGYVCQVDGARCAACGTCASICPFEAVSLDGRARVDLAACMGCGVCVGACALGALTLVRAADKPAPLEVDPRAEEAVEALATSASR